MTLVTQDLSEFALHVRAILGFPVPSISTLTAGTTYALKADHQSEDYQVEGLEEALSVPHTQVRLFGKPMTKPGRRMGVILSTGETVDQARDRSNQAARKINITK